MSGTDGATKLGTGAKGARGALTPPVQAKKLTTGPDRREKQGSWLGTKRATAAAMFETGCTMADVWNATGHTQYNLLKKLAGDGHRVARDGSAINATRGDHQ